MTAATDLKLQISKSLPHPPQKVFEAWLDPTMLARIMIPGTGMTVPEATNDPQVGGRFKIIMLSPTSGEMPHEGTYKVINPHSQIVFTWESPFSTLEDSTVTLDFAATKTGTDLTLTHVRFETEESRANHEGGWTHILESLAAAL